MKMQIKKGKKKKYAKEKKKTLNLNIFMKVIELLKPKVDIDRRDKEQGGGKEK